MSMIRVMATALVAACVFSCNPTNPKFAFNQPEQRGRLEKNGLRFVIMPDPSAEIIEVDVRYEVGSKEDPPGRAGLAHLVEHLMFQQRQAGPDQPSVGVVLRQATLYHNAFTNWDSTHYQAKVRPESLETLIAIEAARLVSGCETIGNEVFLREREVVRNEVRQRLGSPEGQMLVRLLEDVYHEGHPYRRMVGGDDEQLAKIELADVCQFMRDHYVLERVTVIVAGKLDETAAGQFVGRTLGTLPARRGAPRTPVPEVSYQGRPRLVKHELDVDENSVTVVW